MTSTIKWDSAAALIGALMTLSLCTGVANAAGQYDGTWAGVPAVQANSNPDCPPWAGFRLHVANDQFNQEVGRATMHGALAPDGSFTTSGSYVMHRAGIVQVQFNGRVAGNQLNAVYQTRYCTYQMALHRQ